MKVVDQLALPAFSALRVNLPASHSAAAAVVSREPEADSKSPRANNLIRITTRQLY